jgi:hypothetical protein
MSGPRQFSADGCAGATGFDTSGHVPYLLAVIGACRAHLTAQPRKLGIKLTFASHRVSGECAKRSAIQHQTQMLGPRMFAARLNAMGQRHRIACGMAVLERFDPPVHVLTQLVHEDLHFSSNRISASKKFLPGS